MTEQVRNIQKQVKKEVDDLRFEHTMGVMHTAACLSMRYGEELEKTMIAALLHDCAKCIPSEEKLRMCRKNKIEISEAEQENPGLLHAKLGAFLAKKKYDVTDEEILHAIEVHTTGCPDMNLLDKIIYIADYIEPGRAEASNLPEVRKKAFVNLDSCLYQILEDSLEYLKTKGCVIDPMTEKTFLFYKKQREYQEV